MAESEQNALLSGMILSQWPSFQSVEWVAYVQQQVSQVDSTCNQQNRLILCLGQKLFGVAQKVPLEPILIQS